ncbi:MAG: glycine--tRNA ligase subunit beta [Archangiaceae bacterium]|nr:glycine--tRNA ligase subunit beta [Archangiaceae bacterium]
MAELLFELGSEELPARFVVPVLNDLEKLFVEGCKAARINHGAIKTYGTPRRIALVVEGLSEKTEDVVKEVQGPSVKAAFEADGTPKVPATKFAESVKLPVEKLKRVTTPKGEYLAADVEEKGRRVIELLPEVLGACVKKLPFPKSMRWGDVEAAFGRPLQWIVALFGSEVVPVIFSDVKSGRETRGHRFLSPGWITIAKPSDYESALEKAHVVADLSKRRAMLVERLAVAAKKANGTLISDDGLVDQVLNLVELPNPVVGTFEERHLDLPPEVLIQEMKSHQRYFSLTDASGKLLPRFIAVSNTPVKSEALSVKGYERVLRARLTDGRFFFDEDRKIPLQDRLPKLARRNWVQGLGSMAEKTDRIRALAMKLADLAGKGAQRATIERAASLVKCDLETGMVGEFPELQGVMGREYALHGGEPKEVAVAIFEHYLPRGANDSLPTQDAGALIGLADRLDSLVGLFAIGKRPTGAKDEFALRRAAIAVINLVIGKGYRFSLSAALDASLELLGPVLANSKAKPANPPVKVQVLEFIQDRLRPLWGEQHRADIIEAVVAAGIDDLVATHQRLTALSAYVSRPDFSKLAATFKRVGNIVEKQAKDVTKAPVDASKLTDDAEKVLNTEVSKVRDAVHAAIKADDYAGALAKVVPLGPFVDTFFDKVMVMAEDKALRENRVRLLMEIGGLFGTVADFSRIQSES